MSRSDKGKSAATPRDIYLLNWIAEQYGISYERLADLMPEKLSESGLRSFIHRWRTEAKWVETGRLNTKLPKFIWLSRLGLKHFGINYSYQPPPVNDLSHIMKVNDVRLYLERRLGLEVKWESERQINRRTPERAGIHIPDGAIFYQSAYIAIEVELHQKSVKRWKRIFRALMDEYDHAWYFVPDESMKIKLIRAIAEVDKHDEYFSVYLLPTTQEIATRGQIKS